MLNRGSLSKQSHDYDIVEGPVADDQVATRIFLYQEGKITKRTFLEELKFKKPTHQICFCTPESLQMLTLLKSTADADIVLISNHIVKALVSESDYSELQQVIDLWYCSSTYERLTDETTGLYKMPWKQIYRQLLKEIER